MSESSSSEILPINSLKTNQRTWTIKVMILRQGSIEPYKNGKGKLWKLILVDDSGTKIQAVLFDDAAKKFEGLLLYSQTYKISNGVVQKTNPTFQSIHPEIELVLQNYTDVVEVEPNLKWENIKYEFIPFKEVEEKANNRKSIDIFGFVNQVQPSYVITKANGGITHKREILLLNKELELVKVNLWADLAINEGQLLQTIAHKRPIIAISRVHGSIYKGEFQVSTSYLSTIQIDPNGKEVQKLKKWLNSSKDSTKLEVSPFKKLMKEAKEVKLRNILFEPFSLPKDTSYYFKATVESIENNDQPWYNACNGCNKKINVTEYGAECTACKDKNVQYTPRLFLRLEVIEGNDKIVVVLFEEAATILLGCSAPEYIESIREGKEKSRFYRLMCLCKLREYKFLINPNSTTADDASKGSIVVRALEVVEDKKPILIDDDEMLATYRKKKPRSKKEAGINKKITNKKIKKEK